MSVVGTAGKSAGRPARSLEIIPLPHALGAEVRCGDVRALDDASITHHGINDERN